jgi:hypothetical protein
MRLMMLMALLVLTTASSARAARNAWGALRIAGSDSVHTDDGRPAARQQQLLQPQRARVMRKADDPSEFTVQLAGARLARCSLQAACATCIEMRLANFLASGY